MSFGFCPVCQYVLHPWSAVFTLLLHTNLLSMQCQDEDESDNSLPRTTWTTTPPPSAHLPISQPTAESPTSHPPPHQPTAAPPTELQRPKSTNRSRKRFNVGSPDRRPKSRESCKAGRGVFRVHTMRSN